MNNHKHLYRFAPWLLLALVLAVWQVICTGFQVSEFVFPSPWLIAQKIVEFQIGRAHV